VSAPPLPVCAAALIAVALITPICADVAGESQRLVELMELAPGMVAADVGAGEGKWTEALARTVGQDGHVYATEVKSDLVEDLHRQLDRQGLDNVTAILGDQSQVGLPTGCCDAVLLRMVYHHFEDPQAMRASLHRALKPGGLVAIVDIVPQEHWRQLGGVPERGGHGIEPQDLIQEMIADDFELVSQHDDWNGDDDRYCVVFRQAAKAP